MNTLHVRSHIMDAPQEAGHIVIANIVASLAAVKVQETHNRLQNTAALLQPYLSGMDIHHQRHRFIDVPRVVVAREGLFLANNLLNVARSRLNSLYAAITPGFAFDLDDIYTRFLSVHSMLHQADSVNRDNLHLFRMIDGPNNHQTRAVFRNTFSGSESQSNSRR